MRKQEKKAKSLLIQTIKVHIENNKKQYAIVAILFLIGLMIGISFMNNINEESRQSMSNYITDFITCLKGDYQIDNTNLIKSSITNYLTMAIIIWFMGSTVIGIPIVYLMVSLKGFTLGYTISCIIVALGLGKGALFSFITLFFQNMIIIPCIFALAVSGMKLYQSIMKDKRKENIKIEIVRHTIFSLFMTGMLVIASFVEVYLSSNLLNICLKFF